jgi:putative MFS transporter
MSSNSNRSSAAATGVFGSRKSVWAFWIGCLAVTGGVLLHVPMYWMGRNMGFRLAGMPMDPGMYAGMALIVAGVVVAGYGLLPRTAHPLERHSAAVAVTPPEDAPLGRAHWLLMAVLVVALVIDVMKPATLGFVVPGMIKEYAVPKAMMAWFPFSALTGTAVGSLVWGWLADVFGRRASILLSAVMFVGTAICGAMPSFWWNVGMCFLMGLAAGGLLPVAYALLAETLPTRHRGWSLVLVGGLGGVGGYLAASGLSALLQPTFSWRIMWFLNLPTGLILIALNGLIPESARFLLAVGRLREAHALMQKFGATVRPLAPGEEIEGQAHSLGVPAPPRMQLGKTVALSLAALSWSFVNFGLLLWLPNDLAVRGYSAALTGKLLAQSALVALPMVFLTALLYSRWSTKWTLIAMIGIMALGLFGIMGLAVAKGPFSPVLPVGLLLIGSNGLLAILLPYATESYPLRIRGRATGWIAGCSKAGGIVAQVLGVAGAIPGLGVAAAALAVPSIVTMGLVARFGSETLGHDLRELEAPLTDSIGGEAA